MIKVMVCGYLEYGKSCYRDIFQVFVFFKCIYIFIKGLLEFVIASYRCNC